jgi:hypothetical protein
VKRRHVVLSLISASALVVGGFAPSAIGVTTSTSGTEHFLVLSTTESDSSPMVANGPIHARGTDVAVTDNRDRFVFPDGVLRIHHVATSHRESFDPVTCLGRFSEKGTYTVIDGTKAYRNATGNGTYTVKGFFLGCTEGDPSNVTTVTIRASGPLSF